MGKADDKGEPVKTVTIGGKKVEVPIIFVLPEEAGEKEIERYQHPKVHIESKKGEKAESEEKPLDKLTHGKLEEVEKLPFPVPKEKVGTQRDSKGKIIRVGDMLQSDIDERDALYRHATGSGFPQERGVKDSIVAYPEEMPKQKEISTETAEANKGYSDEVKEGGFSQQQAPKKKKKKEPLLSNSWEALRQEWEDILPDESKKGFGKAQALARWYEQNKPKKEKEYLTDEEGDEIEKGVINNQPQIPDQTDKILAELKRKKKPKEKAWEKWLEKRGSPQDISGRIDPRDTSMRDIMPKEGVAYNDSLEQSHAEQSTLAREHPEANTITSYERQARGRKGKPSRRIPLSVTNNPKSGRGVSGIVDDKGHGKAGRGGEKIRHNPKFSQGKPPTGKRNRGGTIGEELREAIADPTKKKSWEKWLQKRDDWDKEEKENDERFSGHKGRDRGTERGKKEGLYEELANPKLEGNLEDESLETHENAGRVGTLWGSTSFDVETDKKTGKPVDVTPSRVVGTGRNSSPHSALANDARYSDGSEAMNITQENAETWKSWLEKKQTRIDRKQEWGDKSKIGIGSWEERPELKPKGRFDKDGKRIPEKGQGQGKLREGAL